MPEAVPSKRWWITPLLFSIVFIAILVYAWTTSEIARELLSKSVMTLAGTVASPFILEATVALVGLVIVLTYNQWRIQKEGDGWVYLAQTEPDQASVEAGAQTPPQRLNGVILPTAPDGATGLEARIAIVEGYLELGLRQDALTHLQMLSVEEQQDPRVIATSAKISEG